MEKYWNMLITFAITYGWRLIAAIIVLFVGFKIIKLITKGISRLMENKNVDKSLQTFLIDFSTYTLKALLIISALSMLGIQMTSFIAMLGAAGFAVGMALSGTLQNFAGGVMILLFKPFEVGHFIEAKGYMGTVSKIQIFNTYLTTPDNKVVIIPNNDLATSSLINYSKEKLRRVDFVFGIAYGDDIKKAKELIMKVIKEDKRILPDPAPFVAIGELADSSVNLTVRVWVHGKDYWDVFFSMNENVYNIFNSNNINIPFPQLDVHLDK